ncbi:adenosine deaminase [Fructilactobacillus vespulae]|uniref:adenosine deaminase n=1 Tax=Fructilactobacillus vespulae TaxID=1249630 RepID=UPI0039B3E724
MLDKVAIQKFPKAELHCHLDGSIRPQTLQKIAAMTGAEIGTDLATVMEKMTAPQNAENLADYLQPFEFVLQYLQSEKALEMAAFDVMEQAYHDGVKYIEIRFAPSLSMEKGLTVAETIAAVAAGISHAERQFPIYGNILVCGMRTDSENEVEQIFTRSKAINEKVVGIDLAGPEVAGFVADYQDSFALIVDGEKVQLTLHAGECGCANNILAAIAAGSKRIGHGIAALGNQDVEEQLLEKEVCIEGCPTSNVQTHALKSKSDYPFQRWMKQGQKLCLNTDNRTVSVTTLTDEYYEMAVHHEMTMQQLKQCNQNAVQSSFASAPLKAELLEAISEY